MTRILLILLLPVVISTMAIAQGYIYIQGDKATPFYVKIDGVMQQRYGKYHCIAPNVKAGKRNVEILFQQNAYPAVSFTIDLPENGQRGFLINIEGDVFWLYDLATAARTDPEKTSEHEK